MRGIGIAALLAVPLVAGAAGAETPKTAPSDLFVSVSLVPYPQGGMVLVPGDRSDRAAYVVEIALTSGKGLDAAPPTTIWGHKRFVAFADERTEGSFTSAGLSVDYAVKIEPGKRTADARVRVTRAGEFLVGASTHVLLAAPNAGVRPAPGP